MEVLVRNVMVFTNARYAMIHSATAVESIIQPRVIVKSVRTKCAVAPAGVNLAAVLAGRSRVACVPNRKRNVVCAVDLLVMDVEGSTHAHPAVKNSVRIAVPKKRNHASTVVNIYATRVNIPHNCSTFRNVKDATSSIVETAEKVFVVTLAIAIIVPNA